MHHVMQCHAWCGMVPSKSFHVLMLSSPKQLAKQRTFHTDSPLQVVGTTWKVFWVAGRACQIRSLPPRKNHQMRKMENSEFCSHRGWSFSLLLQSELAGFVTPPPDLETDGRGNNWGLLFDRL